MEIKVKLLELFPLEKIYEDFFQWLSNEYSSLDYIEIEEITSGDDKVISISKADKLTPYQYKVMYNVNAGTYYEVNIAIGHFKTADKNGFMEIEKGVAKLSYNYDLSLYDAELYYDKMHEKADNNG